MSRPSDAQVFRLRAAIARDQSKYWWRMFWKPAPSPKELDRRERLWMWWGSVGFIAQVNANTLAREADRSAQHER